MSDSEKQKLAQPDIESEIGEEQLKEMMKREMLEGIESAIQSNPEIVVKALKKMMGKDK